MAKKIVNVVYKVDSSELDKAKATIQSTAQTTKQAEQAMGSYSNTAKQTGTVISNTIAGMTLRMQQLKAQIELTNQSDTQRIEKLKNEYNQLRQKVDEFNKSLSQQQQQGQSLIGIFQSLGNTLGIAFGIATLQRMGAAVIEMTELAGRVDGLNRGFRTTFPNALALLDQLRTRTHGVLTDFELMQRTQLAQNLGVDLKELGTIMEFVLVRTQRTGQNFDVLLEKFIRGIGVKSPRLLDDLGISSYRLKQSLDGVAMSTISIGDFTKKVSEIAQEELSKMGGYVETSETTVKQLGVSWQNLKLEISKKVESSGFIQFLSAVVDKLRYAIMSQEEFDAEVTKLVASKNIEKLGQQTAESVQNEIANRKKLIETLQAEKKELSSRNDELIKQHSPATIDEQANIKREFNLRKNKIAVITEELRILEAEQLEIKKESEAQKVQKGIIEDLTDKIKNLKDALEKATSLDAVGRINQQISELERKKKAFENATPINFNVDEAKNDAAEVENLLRTTNEEINKEADESYKEGLQILHNAQSDEKKSIESQNAIKNQLAKEQADEEKRIAKEKEDYKKRLIKAAENTALDSLQNILYYTLINRQNDLQDLSAYYDAQIEAAGNNERAKKKIESDRKKAEDAARNQQINDDKEAAITKIEIDTAVNIIRSIMNNGGFLTGWPFGLMAAAAGAVQIATVQSVRSRSLSTRAFAHGEVDIDGPGTTTSDSINARLSKGESVINAQATAASRNLLEAINERKIDDRILHQLAVSGGSQQAIFDSQSIVNAIERNKVDLAVNGYTLMESRQVGANFRQKIRAKVQGYR